MTRPLAEAAHDAIIATLAAAPIVPPFVLVKQATLDLPSTTAECLNVLRDPQPPEIIDELIGYGEPGSIVDWRQHFSIEWMVRGGDPTLRQARFEAGMLAIGAALVTNPTLGVTFAYARLGAPDRAAHDLATAPATEAILIPLIVTLRGASPLA